MNPLHKQKMKTNPADHDEKRNRLHSWPLLPLSLLSSTHTRTLHLRPIDFPWHTNCTVLNFVPMHLHEKPVLLRVVYIFINYVTSPVSIWFHSSSASWCAGAFRFHHMTSNRELQPPPLGAFDWMRVCVWCHKVSIYNGNITSRASVKRRWRKIKWKWK